MPTGIRLEQEKTGRRETMVEQYRRLVQDTSFSPDYSVFNYKGRACLIQDQKCPYLSPLNKRCYANSINRQVCKDKRRI
ncbi:MAG: hypothetical protein JSW01_01205 [Candidatus Bathyarchaeota archaeon]|nr:MAG: hypothetical protein JSW01_01205 [Candidatus Bathyarchaeota archaeon]